MKIVEKLPVLLAILFFTITLVACGQSPGVDHVTAEYILEENPNADIIQEHDSIFRNMADVRTEEQLASYEFSKGELQGEIKNQTTNIGDFEHLTATHLPEGTKIFSANSGEAFEKGEPGVLMAEVNGRTLYYQQIVLE
ncbi:hypothetical protein HNQ44_003009 [Planomicrobium koreense]|uniref:Uncharacterized protein n=1 Tax=Planococcus koreensis TaxID=112331 RepID=A0A7W8CVB1_9BACL|nr:hypothetical protein [Planococcus koreensis]MBB5181544.1 hypothetical protein [Planococcus koreensis]